MTQNSQEHLIGVRVIENLVDCCILVELYRRCGILDSVKGKRKLRVYSLEELLHGSFSWFLIFLIRLSLIRIEK